MHARIEDRPMPPPAARHYPHDRRRGNAQKYGLFSTHVVAAGEDPAAFRAFRTAIVAAYRPRDDAEIWLADEIAGTMWRTRRLRRTETRIWDKLPAAAKATAAKPVDDYDGHYIAAMRARRRPIAQALAILAEAGEGDPDGLLYDDALAALDGQTREYWNAYLDPDVRRLETPRFGAVVWHASMVVRGRWRPAATSLNGWLRQVAAADAEAAASLSKKYGDPVFPDARGEAAQAETLEARWAAALDTSAMRSFLRAEAHLDRRLSRRLIDLERHRRLCAREPVPPTFDFEEDENGDSAVVAENSGTAPMQLGPTLPASPEAPRVAPPTSSLVGADLRSAQGACRANVSDGPASPQAEAPGADLRSAPTQTATGGALPAAPVVRPTPPLPAAPATRADFVAHARARRAILERTIEALAGVGRPPAGYEAALAMLGEDAMGGALRRWWEMRIIHAPGVRETWDDISGRHPFWDNNRTAGALLDWLREVHYADRCLLAEAGTNHRGRGR